MQVGCSTDRVFRSDATMKRLYAAISREAIVSVKAPQVMHFLDKLTSPKEIDGHHVKGFNFFDKTEHDLLCALHHPEFNIRGVRRADLKPFLSHLSVARITRYLKRLCDFWLIKKVVGTYRYYLTRTGRNAISAACRLSEQLIIPALAAWQNLLRIREE